MQVAGGRPQRKTLRMDLTQKHQAVFGLACS